MSLLGASKRAALDPWVRLLPPRFVSTRRAHGGHVFFLPVSPIFFPFPFSQRFYFISLFSFFFLCYLLYRHFSFSLSFILSFTLSPLSLYLSFFLLYRPLAFFLFILFLLRKRIFYISVLSQSCFMLFLGCLLFSQGAKEK